MISSPCKTCPRNNQSKEECYKDCAILQAIQNIQLASPKDPVASGIDYSEENEFAIHHTTAQRLPPFGS